jgi:hypothetical protein
MRTLLELVALRLNKTTIENSLLKKRTYIEWKSG